MRGILHVMFYESSARVVLTRNRFVNLDAEAANTLYAHVHAAVAAAIEHARAEVPRANTKGTR